MSNAWIIEYRNRIKRALRRRDDAPSLLPHSFSSLVRIFAVGLRSIWSSRIFGQRRNKFRSMLRNEAGVAAIEFAIVLPVFLILTSGILAYGIYFGAAHGVAQLAADAARVSVAGLDDTERTTLATAHIDANASGFAFIERSKVTVVAGPSPTDPAQFTVDIRYDASDLPIWALAGLVPLPSKVIERSSTIRRGGQ